MLGHLAHAGHHGHHAFHAAHLEHLFQLHAQVVHVELTLHHALHHLLGLFGLDGFLRALDEADDVAHAEDSARDTLGLEGLDGVHLLAEADEADRLAGDGAHRERGAAAAVAVHPGEDDTGHADLVVEFGRDVHRVLTGEAVDHQQRLARADHVADILGPFGDLDRVLALDDRQGVDADLLAQHFKLMHGCRAIDVERRHEHALALAVLQTFRDLAGGRRLAAALQPHHKDRRGRVVDFELAGVLVAAQHVDQRVVHDFDDLLARGHRLGDRLAGGLVLHRLDEIARHGQLHVGLEQRDTHLAQRGLDVILGKRLVRRSKTPERRSDRLSNMFRLLKTVDLCPLLRKGTRNAQTPPRA